MKRTFTYLPFILGFIVYLFLLSNSGGAPAQSSGAPGETTCGRSGCHAVAENIGGAAIEIAFNEGSLEYVPGETYSMSVGLSSSMNEARNGFQLVALDSLNNNAGSWELVEASTTQIRAGNTFGDRSYLTHTAAGNGQTSWMVNWVAPAELIGDVNFFLAVNDADGNGGRTGDDIYITNLSINPASSTSTSVLDLLAKNITVYPNPARDFVKIESSGVDILNTSVYDATGTIVATSFNPTSLNLNNLAKGIYFLKIETPEGLLMKKLLLN